MAFWGAVGGPGPRVWGAERGGAGFEVLECFGVLREHGTWFWGAGAFLWGAAEGCQAGGGWSHTAAPQHAHSTCCFLQLLRARDTHRPGLLVLRKISQIIKHFFKKKRLILTDLFSCCSAAPP